MKRRSFLTLSTLSAFPIAARAADEALDWNDTVNREGLTFKAVAEDGKINLQVQLIRPAEDEVIGVRDEKGELRGFRYKGKDQPYPFHPGSTLLTRFDLTWDGKAMEIPKRFWDDLADLRIETSTLELAKIPPAHHWKAVEFLDGLRQPRVLLSAEGGTILIEWERGEECDSHSTIRWIVSKSGTVLRHRHCPPHEC